VSNSNFRRSFDKNNCVNCSYEGVDNGISCCCNDWVKFDILFPSHSTCDDFRSYKESLERSYYSGYTRDEYIKYYTNKKDNFFKNMLLDELLKDIDDFIKEFKSTADMYGEDLHTVEYKCDVEQQINLYLEVAERLEKLANKYRKDPSPNQ
jgi:hypothetical protein